MTFGLILTFYRLYGATNENGVYQNGCFDILREYVS